MIKHKKQNTAIIHKVLVYDKDNHAQLGFGWVLYRDDGRMFVPELFHDDGTQIPS